MSKSYKQFCGLARGLDVVGERWTLLVVRNLLLGPKRYGDLQAMLPGVPTNLLAKRLREMQASGLIVKTKLAPPANVPVYALGEAGRALEPAIMELARWGGRYMDAPRRDDAIDVGWALLSTKRRYLGGETLSVELAIDDRTFTLALDPGYLGVEERESPTSPLRLRGSTQAFREFLFGGLPTRERLLAAGIVVVAGDSALVDRWLSRFGPPERMRPTDGPPARPSPGARSRDGANRPHRLSSRRS